MQATSAFRLKIGDARYVPRTARLFAESFTPSILLEVQRRGAAASVLRKPHINVATPCHQLIPTQLCGISKGVQNVEVAALFNADILDPFAGRRTCRRRRTSPTPASSPPSSRRGRSGRSSATPSRGPSSGAPSSKPR